MKKWNLKVKSNPQDISNNLESAFKSVEGFSFNINRGNRDSIKFEMRKRILYAWYLPYVNSITVNGKLSKTENLNGTNVEIIFNQHFLWKSVIFIHIILGLGFLTAMILEKSNNAFTYLFGAIFLASGIFLWVKMQKKYEINIVEYKTLISRTLGL